MHLDIGYKIRNNYEIVKILGQGGFGIVYLVKNLERLDDLMVIKELFAREFSSRGRDGFTVYNKLNTKEIFEKIKNDIKREINTLRNINNKNIIKAYGYFEENNTIYSIMEFLQGEDLEKYLDEGNLFDEVEAKELLKQLIHGLKELHIKNIIHRDIKPNNIIRTNSGIYKIIDFTTNRSYSDGVITTITGFQNNFYTPPELVQQKNTTIGNYSDIYSMGITLISLLLKDRNSLPMLMDRFIDNSDFLAVVNGLTISESFKEVLLKMTQLKSKDRFQTLEEIEQRLFQTFGDIKRAKRIETSIDFNEEMDSVEDDKREESSSWVKKSVIFVLFGIIGFGGYRFYIDSTQKQPYTIIDKPFQETNPSSSIAIEEQVTSTPPHVVKQVHFSNERLRRFLTEFIASGESNSPKETLQYYADNLKRYFNLKNATKRDIFKDKVRYYKKWYQRAFSLVDFKIIDTYSRDGIEYCEVRQNIKWKVKSSSISKSGKSINRLTVKKVANRFEIVSIYSIKVKTDVSQKIALTENNRKEVVYLKNDNLTLNLSYNSTVKRGEKVTIRASLRNRGGQATRGGITLSFPQIYDIGGKVVRNNFGGLKKYGTSDKVYNQEAKKAIYAKYLMLESNDEEWNRGEEHSFVIELNVPDEVNRFMIQVRGALRKRIVPRTGSRDQQGYYCRVITINVIE